MKNNDLYLDRQLLLQISEGNGLAFEQLYEQLKPQMTGYIARLVKVEAGVMEILQEALIRVWLNRDKLPELEQPVAWIYRIVANECFRYFRRNGLQQRLATDLRQRSNDTSRQTEIELSYRETKQVIQELVELLPPRHREIFRLSREGGLKMQEIADATGLSYRYVKKVLMEALKMIREKLVAMGRYTLPILWWLFS